MFNAPLSLHRAQDLIRILHPAADSHVADLGCGDGAFLRLMAARYAIRGVGIDKNIHHIKLALSEPVPEPQAGKLTFSCTDAAAFLHGMDPADIIICIGAEFIFRGLAGLLQAVKPHLKPSGRLLVGTIYWKQEVDPAYLALMGGENPHHDLLTTVQLAHMAGYLPVAIQRSNDDEWDSFEGQHARQRYQRAIAGDDSDLRDQTWEWQQGYLRWGMETMGFCWLVLLRP